MIPYQTEMTIHEKATGHEDYLITGTKKREKIRGLWCKTCKKYVSVIQFTKRRGLIGITG